MRNAKFKAMMLAGALFALTVGPNTASADTDFTERIDGSSRIDTAIEVSQELYPDSAADGPNYVILARSDDFPDALAGASLVNDDGVVNPILLTPSNGLDQDVEDEIERLMDLGGLSGSVDKDEDGTQVYLLGGEKALSESVINDLEDNNDIDEDDITRLSGDDRFETAAAIDDELVAGDAFGHEGNGVIIATGHNFPDALAAAGWAAESNTPILLVSKDEIPDGTEEALSEGDSDSMIIVGGEMVISDSVKDDLDDFNDGNSRRIAGDNRYETALDFATEVWEMDEDDNNDGQNLIFVRGDDFPDALAGAALSLEAGGIPTLLTTTSKLEENTNDFLEDAFEDEEEGFGWVLGGTSAISNSTEEEICDAVSDGDCDIDENSPDLDLDSPDEGQGFELGQNVDIDGTVDDDTTDVEDLDISIDITSGNTSVLSDTTDADEDGDFTFNWLPAAAGTYEIEVTVEDEDNDETSETRTVVVTDSNCVPTVTPDGYTLSPVVPDNPLNLLEGQQVWYSTTAGDSVLFEICNGGTVSFTILQGTIPANPTPIPAGDTGTVSVVIDGVPAVNQCDSVLANAASCFLVSETGFPPTVDAYTFSTPGAATVEVTTTTAPFIIVNDSWL